ncbi:MAG TPA: hypothetical protein VGR05_09050, partial [Sphingomicrobium sp.]|nr:hypothetical protein [Sphingomicrobium sp.]
RRNGSDEIALKVETKHCHSPFLTRPPNPAAHAAYYSRAVPIPDFGHFMSQSMPQRGGVGGISHQQLGKLTNCSYSPAPRRNEGRRRALERPTTFTKKE